MNVIHFCFCIALAFLGVSSFPHQDRYLIFFHSYKPSHLHVSYLSDISKRNEISVKSVRNNYDLGCYEPIPTDFLLVEFQSESDKEKMDVIIKSKTISAEIKYMYPELRKTRKLLRDTSRSFLPLKPTEKSSNKNNFEYRFSVNAGEVLEIKALREAKKTTGKGVRVGVFDTGVSDSYKANNEENIKMVKNWTEEKYLGSDFNGHGTFVASIFVNRDSGCEGLAPDVELYIFKVFTKNEESRTSWFLDAFNYAIHLKLDLINFSIGSTDFTDFPFVEKVKEVVANNITLISAAGNDGPFFGTINNPADQLEVIAVGGYDSESETVATYSSRGNIP
jgi:membrane-bound transcription factor site-1 protease